MFRINKKVLVIAGLAILLAVTGVLNWKFAADKKARQQAEGNGGTEQTVSSFADFRTERERVRTQ